MKENPFLSRIRSGKIKNKEELKKAFRKTAKALHPDHTRNGGNGDNFIKMMEHYEEAMTFLDSEKNNGVPGGTSFDSNPNQDKTSSSQWKTRFFKQLLLIDLLENPDFFLLGNPFNEMKTRLVSDAEREMFDSFELWRPEDSLLLKEAWEDYRKIKMEKPENTLENLRKVPLKNQLKTLLFNMAKFALSGNNIYRLHFKGGWEPVSVQTKEKGFDRLSDFLELLKNELHL